MPYAMDAPWQNAHKKKGRVKTLPFDPASREAEIFNRLRVVRTRSDTEAREINKRFSYCVEHHVLSVASERTRDG
jgi:hypothetical protein